MTQNADRMACPVCGTKRNIVTDSRTRDSGIIYRRRCCDNGHKFSTKEMVVWRTKPTPEGEYYGA